LNAAIWLNNGPLPESVCADPHNKLYGFYRRLNDGNFEFVSFCNPKANEWVSMHKDDFARLIDRATRPNKKEEEKTERTYELDNHLWLE
jgi:hypothetical protein